MSSPSFDPSSAPGESVSPHEKPFDPLLAGISDVEALRLACHLPNEHRDVLMEILGVKELDPNLMEAGIAGYSSPHLPPLRDYLREALVALDFTQSYLYDALDRPVDSLFHNEVDQPPLNFGELTSCSLYFGDALSVTEIATKLSVSESEVVEVLSSACQKLARYTRFGISQIAFDIPVDATNIPPGATKYWCNAPLVSLDLLRTRRDLVLETRAFVGMRPIPGELIAEAALGAFRSMTLSERTFSLLHDMYRANLAEVAEMFEVDDVTVLGAVHESRVKIRCAIRDLLEEEGYISAAVDDADFSCPVFGDPSPLPVSHPSHE